MNIRDLPEEAKADFSYRNHFEDLMHEMDAAQKESSNNETQARVRELAEKILKKDFNDLHYCQEPMQAKTHSQVFAVSNEDENAALYATRKLKL